MDIQKFRESRESELTAFQRQYDSLKAEYTSSLSSAIQERDPATQQELIQRVLQLNTTMADELRTILSKINQGANGFKSADLNQLTNELIQYQKEYEEIEQSKDKVNTLKKIHSDTKGKTNAITTMYMVYLAVLVILLIVVVYLVFKTEWARQAASIVPKVLSQ